MSLARDIADLGSVTTRLDTVGGSSGALSNRNLIINGAMKVAQRGTQTNSTNAYTACDRWEFAEGGSSVITSSQDSDSPQGFANSLKLDVTTASGTPSSGDYAILRTKLEGQDLQNLLYGTSSAKQITISFSVKSPKTGTHYVELVHNDAAYQNSIAYTVNSADTWENKVVTFDGYQTTAFDDDNNASLLIYFWLMAGSDYTSGTHTSNTWHNDNTKRAAGQVNVMDNTSNNFYLTGVQLEVGDTATDFEHRSYGDELARCQRYFYSVTAGADNTSVAAGAYYTATSVYATVFFPVTMRNNPSLISSNTSGHFHIFRNGNVDAIDGWSGLQNTGLSQSTIYVGSGPNSTTGSACWIETNDADAVTQFNAEL